MTDVLAFIRLALRNVVTFLNKSQMSPTPALIQLQPPSPLFKHLLAFFAHLKTDAFSQKHQPRICLTCWRLFTIENEGLHPPRNTTTPAGHMRTGTFINMREATAQGLIDVASKNGRWREASGEMEMFGMDEVLREEGKRVTGVELCQSSSEAPAVNGSAETIKINLQPPLVTDSKSKKQSNNRISKKRPVQVPTTQLHFEFYPQQPQSRSLFSNMLKPPQQQKPPKYTTPSVYTTPDSLHSLTDSRTLLHNNPQALFANYELLNFARKTADSISEISQKIHDLTANVSLIKDTVALISANQNGNNPKENGIHPEQNGNPFSIGNTTNLNDNNSEIEREFQEQVRDFQIDSGIIKQSTAQDQYQSFINGFILTKEHQRRQQQETITIEIEDDDSPRVAPEQQQEVVQLDIQEEQQQEQLQGELEVSVEQRCQEIVPIQELDQELVEEQVQQPLEVQEQVCEPIIQEQAPQVIDEALAVVNEEVDLQQEPRVTMTQSDNEEVDDTWAQQTQTEEIQRTSEVDIQAQSEKDQPQVFNDTQ
ncbi:hypothetical protein FGO68_gene4591 [Halteria grandinella]|uniref:Uncharacterized protein n=1 Tax=Halteria grandinella TaxID=5974 RepID=A0A8J8NSW5_HALGN|nr:hypothetical protein FGO68_gene4591 [Halteria grandinella]